MDLTFLLIIDAIALAVATVIITYFFFRDMFKR